MISEAVTAGMQAQRLTCQPCSWTHGSWQGPRWWTARNPEQTTGGSVGRANASQQMPVICSACCAVLCSLIHKSHFH